MLVLNNINKSFKNIKVLKNISFTLQENRIFAFLGPNTKNVVEYRTLGSLHCTLCFTLQILPLLHA